MPAGGSPHRASRRCRTKWHNVLRIQVVQESLDSARILVVPARGFGAEDAAQLLANARARVPADVHLTVEIANWLERTPRGKTPLIVHRSGGSRGIAPRGRGARDDALSCARCSNPAGISSV